MSAPANEAHPEAAPAVAPAQRRGNWENWFFAFLLLVGVGCRFYGLNWDESALLHPDERFCLDVAQRIQPPRGWGEFFASWYSPLNPANTGNQIATHYVYGQLPLFLLKGVMAIWSGVPPILLGRGLSGLFDGATVVFTLFIARRLFGTRHALFAGALVALAALHIQQSHFFVTDTFATAFLTASFWAGTRFLDSKRIGDAALLGLFWGLALACKISAALYVVAIIAFLSYGAFGNTCSRKAWISILACLGAAILAFRLGHPMAFRGVAWGGLFDLRPEPHFWQEIANQGLITRGEVDAPFNVQWIGTKPWLFSFRNLGSWGYGWALWASGLAGLAAFAWQLRGKTNRVEAATTHVLVVAALLFLTLFGVQGATFSKFSRYYLPLTPLVALFATYFWREAARKNARFGWGPPLAAFWTVCWCLAVTSIYGRRHPRIVASHWIVNNIAPNTPVANETTWDESVPLNWVPLPHRSAPIFAQNLEIFDLETPLKRERMKSILNNSEWIFMSSGRAWQNIPRWRQKWPLATEFYRALWNGNLGFHIEREFTNDPRLGPWQFPDGDAEEALHVYDHPRVILWKKNADYSPQKVRDILEGVALPTQQDWKPRDAQF